MAKDQILERLKKELRSLLITSKVGLSVQELERDYRMLIGSPLPVKSLEYRSTIEMVHDMPDVVTIQTKADGTLILIAVVNEETRAVSEMVSKQKFGKRTIHRRRLTKPCYQKDLVRRGRIAPVLPASLKSDLRDLLSISPLLVSQLETAFYNRFGRNFQYTRYGFYSLLEVLRSVSDMVQVTQTRAGSMLMLKTPYIHAPFTGLSTKPLNNRSYNQVTSIKSTPLCNAVKAETHYSQKKPSVKGVPLPLASSAAVPSKGLTPAPSAASLFTGSTVAAVPSTVPISAAVPSTVPIPAAAPSSVPIPAAVPFSVPIPAAVPSSVPIPAASLSTGPMPARSAAAPPTDPTPAPSATAPCTGPTLLDKLFKAAEAQYYASKYSLANNTKVNVNFGTGFSTEDSNSVKITKSSPCSLPPAIIQNTSRNLHVQPPPIVETVAADMTCLATDDLKVDKADPNIDVNFQELKEKLDKNLKLCLSQTRAGSVISSELRQEIKNVVHKYPEGLSISKLSVLYKEHTGKKLLFNELGFMSVLELVGSLGDMLCLESTEDGDWCIFDAETKCKENVSGKVLLHTDNISRWNSATETPKLVKPLVIKSSPAEGNQLWNFLSDLKLSSKDQGIPPDAVRKQKLHCLPCMKRGFAVGVFVENVTSPSEFYIRCYSKDTSQQLEDMMIEMRGLYSNAKVSDRYVVPDNCVSVGEIYAVRVEGDVWWYRVIVHSVISPKEVQVYYPDFGNLKTVKRQWLRFLKACYMKLPAQAVPSSLALVKPIENQWSTEAMKIFKQYSTCGPLVGIVLQCVFGRLYLYLCDTSTDDDVYLHQLLINRNHASIVQDLGYYKDLQNYNTFIHYLIQSSEQSQEPTVPSEKNTAEFVNEEKSIIQVEEETELKMGFLEAVPSGEDVWDENWSLSGSTVAINNVLKPFIENTDDLQNQEPVNGCANSTDIDCQSHPLEDFYISLIKSRNSLEKASVSPPSRCGLYDDSEIPQPANGHSPPVTSEENQPSAEKRNVMVFQESLSDDKATKGSGPLIGFRKFQIPRRSTTVALGPAARLAASPSNFLSWLSDSVKI